MKKVLVIDSDLHFANTLKMYFRKNDFECLICTDANELDSILTKHRFDLILCSTQVVHKSGMELAVSLKTKLKLDGTALILITTNNNASMNANYLELEADAILHKPISFQNLLDTINDLSISHI